MKHYSAAEWSAFKHRGIIEPDLTIMETHLLECESCLSLFLDLTDELELTQVYAIIPPDFSRNTMAFIKHSQISQARHKRSRDKIKRLLSYYVTAAAVTLMLVSGGLFQAPVSSTAWTSAPAAIVPAKPDSLIFTWPARLVETSSSWTQLIPKESPHFKEVLW